MNPLGLPSAVLIGAVIAVAVLLSVLEWRRPSRRYRVPRLIAIATAVAALAFLALTPDGKFAPAGGTSAVLYTPALTSTPEVAPAAGEEIYALPDSGAVPAGALRIPDLGYLRQQRPALRNLRVLGDGIHSVDTKAVATWNIQWAAPPARWERPLIVAAQYETALHVGDAPEIRGRLGGLRAGEPGRLILTAPDESTVTLDVPANTSSNEAPYMIRAAPTKAAGRFTWKLRLCSALHPLEVWEEETLGISVRDAELSRVLVLESMPHWDTARLGAWYERIGGTFVSRTLVSQDRFRFAGTKGTTPEFRTLDAQRIAVYDILIADRAAVAGLSALERETLRHAVEEGRLGVLILADSANGAPGPAPSVDAPDFFLPWQSKPVGEGTDRAAARDARLHGDGTARVPPESVSVAPLELELRDDQVPLLRDDQDRIVAARIDHGAGRVAFTLVRDTWRWERGDRPAAFAEFWSWLLDAVAPQPALEATQRAIGWIAAQRTTVDEPMVLAWSTRGLPTPVEILAPSGTRSRVALLEDALEPTLWSGIYWPRETGWHRAAPGAPGSTVDFWVDAPSAWPGVRATESRRFTSELAARPRLTTTPTTLPAGDDAARRWFAWAAFLVAAGFLWLEPRLTRAA